MLLRRVDDKLIKADSLIKIDFMNKRFREFSSIVLYIEILTLFSMGVYVGYYFAAGEIQRKYVNKLN